MAKPRVRVPRKPVTQGDVFEIKTLMSHRMESGHRRDLKTGKPIPKTYVKVYARLRDGRVKFYKDGYTDLRGRFDYTSLNTNELDIVQRFAVLVASDKNGALVREAAPPKR